MGSDSPGECVTDQHIADTVATAALSGLVHDDAAARDTYAPTLIANHDGRTMDRAIGEELETSAEFDMSVAFVSQGMIQALKQHFLDFSEHAHPHSGRIFTSTYNYFNSPQVFHELLALHRSAGIDVFIWQSDTRPDATAPLASYPYHPKGYVFRRAAEDKTLYSAYVGSSNLTYTALHTNREWNLKISALDEGTLVEQLLEELDEQRQESIPLTDEWLHQYEKEFRRYAPARPNPLATIPAAPITPNALQREALEHLQALRDQGESQALIISATGTGKTYLSAFDARRCHPRRLLYIAQQEQILAKSMKSYRQIFGKTHHTSGIFSGTSKAHDSDYMFATVQTMSQPAVLKSFSRDHFDYIVIDEVHHAAAPSYRRIIDHFTPRFMLGMTATPERTDGENIFTLFGNNIAYEIRLQRALEEGMVCPFHYYGVHEYIEEPPADASTTTVNAHADPAQWSASERTGLSRWFETLVDPKRVRYIIDTIQVYSQAGTPVHGLVFCSRQDEAVRLSTLFNDQFNQQAERQYRTVSVTGATPRPQRDSAITQLENGTLDYIFTVDLFNEGIDIPAINQIVMLRQTQSSIIFTQQLGRGLRKVPGKDSVVVIDFIGNYANNYLIPIALYGNTGDRDIARKNLQRETIGVTSISFDRIARKRILASLDRADFSEMKLLAEQYRQLRFELNRIPMLMDFAQTDPSLIVTLATKCDDYLEFVESRERSLARGKHADSSYFDSLQPTNAGERAILKMLTVTQLNGIRPHELLALAYLCDIPYATSGPKFIHHSLGSGTIPANRIIDAASLANQVTIFHPLADASAEQCASALRCLDLSYYTTTNRARFGGVPLISPASTTETRSSQPWRISDPLRRALNENRTFAEFFTDTVQAGLFKSATRFSEAERHHRIAPRGLIYGEKYSVFDVMRLCGWHQEQVAQNVGGYRLDRETSSLPIFIKYETSQYQDRFITPRELIWFSKNGRSLHSSEYRWLLDGTQHDIPWSATHFVPVFIRRKQETKASSYYYVGNVVAISDAHETLNRTKVGSSARVVIASLKLEHPVDPVLLDHLTGRCES